MPENRYTLMNLTIKSICTRTLLAATIFLFPNGMTIEADSPFSTLSRKLASASPDLKVAELTLSSEQASLKAEVAPADPEVEFEHLWPSTSGELNRWSVGASQEIPDFRKMSATAKVVSAIDNRKSIERLALEKMAAYDAEQRLLRLIGARKDLDMLKRIHENFDSLTITYDRAWEKGEVTILDLNKIKIEHARASSAHSQAEGEVAALMEEIITLSNGTISSEELSTLTDYPIFPEVNDTIDLDDAIRGSVQYKSLEAQSDVARAKVNLASKSRFPRFTLGYVHAYEDGNHFNGLSAGMTLPVFSRSAEKASSVAEQLAIDETKRRQLAEMIAGAEADRAMLKALTEQLAMLAPAINNTNNFRLLKLALEGGEISLLDYLQEVSYFVEAAREYNAARLAHALACASIARYL